MAHKKVSEDAQPILVPENTDTKTDALVPDTPEADQHIPPAPDPSDKSRRAAFRAFFRSKLWMIGTPIFVIALVAIGFFVKPVRYAVLNGVGSSTASFTIIDDETKTPVEGASIRIGDKVAKTDKKGKATVRDIDYGNSSYTISKENYDTKTAKIVITGSPFAVGTIRLHSQGIPLAVTGTQTLNKKALGRFVVAVKDTNISATANADGVAILKVPTAKLGTISLIASADGFVAKPFEVSVASGADNKAAVALTKTGRQYFLSNRDGKIGVYAADLDGGNQELIIPGTNFGNDDGQLSVSPNNAYGVLVSRRDNLKDKNGQLSSAVFSIDFAKKDIKRIDEGAYEFAMYDWFSDSHLAYMAYHSESRADNFKIKSVNVKTGQLSTIAQYKNYAGVYMFGDAPSHIYVIPHDGDGVDALLAINLSNKNQQELYRVAGGNIDFSGRDAYGYATFQSYVYNRYVPASNQWITVKLADRSTATSSTRPSVRYLGYTASPDASSVAWTENRDSNNSLILGDSKAENGKAMAFNFSVDGIARWVSNDTLIVSGTDNRVQRLYTIDIVTGTATPIAATFNGYYH